MPTLSESFIPQIMKDNAPPEDKGEGWALGAQLAQLQQQKQQQAAMLQQKQQELNQAKWEKVGNYYKQYDAMPDGPGKKLYGIKSGHESSEC